MTKIDPVIHNEWLFAKMNSGDPDFPDFPTWLANNHYRLAQQIRASGSLERHAVKVFMIAVGVGVLLVFILSLLGSTLLYSLIK